MKREPPNMTTLRTDEQLLAAYRRGDRGAIEELARRYERAWLGAALGLVGGRRELALDAVQETWMRIIHFADQFDGRSQFRTWAYRILINRSRDLLARMNGQATAGLSDDATIPDEGRGPLIEAADERERVRRAVSQLSADQRAIVLLCYHSGLTHEEAADVLKLPGGTLKSRLHAALTELREILGPEYQA